MPKTGFLRRSCLNNEIFSHKPILQSCFLWPPFYWWYSKQWYWYRTQIYSKIGIRTDMCWYMLLQSPKSTQELVWMFGFEPICKLWIALKLRGLGATQLVVTALRPRPLAALSDRRPSRIAESSCAVMTIENIADTSFPQTRPKQWAALRDISAGNRSSKTQEISHGRSSALSKILRGCISMQK